MILVQLLQLLLKASQDKKFVCEEAEKAMRAMAASMPPLPLLKKLKAYVRHANLRVRAKAAVAIAHCASRMVRQVAKFVEYEKFWNIKDPIFI